MKKITKKDLRGLKQLLPIQGKAEMRHYVGAILMVIGMETGIIPIPILIMVAIQAIMVIIMMARDTVFLR